MRNINIDFYNSGNTIILGYTNEHLATNLNFVVPAEFRDGYSYKLIFNLENNQEYMELFASYPITYKVSNNIMSAGTSGHLQLSVLKKQDNGEVMVAQSGIIPFKVLSSLADNNTEIGEYTNTIETLIAEFVSNLQNINSRELKANKIVTGEQITNKEENYPSIQYLEDNYPTNDDVYLIDEADSKFLASDHEKNVLTKHLNDKAVTTDKIQDNAISNEKIADSAVTENKIADESVTNSKLSKNSVTTDKIKIGSVTSSKLASDAVNENVLNSDLKAKINSKLDTPDIEGIAGQVLMHTGGNKPVWGTVSGGSGGTGTSNYLELENKPSINDVSLVGNITLEELGIKNGSDGTDGVGIKSIEQTTTSTSDNGINVINIVLTDDTQSTVTVRNGSKGSPGLQGEKGDTGSAGKDGKDGVGIENIETSISSEDNGLNPIVITLTDGTEYTVYTKNGSKGSQGTSVKVKSVATSLEDDGNNIVKFTDGSTLTIKNGSKGSQGETGASGTNGKDGYTPVKGTDYWTNEDKAEIIEEINLSLIGIPKYIKTEAERVATNVQSVRTGQSFTFAGFSDAHIAYSDASKTSVLHAGMGLKCIREIANVDLVAHFGDYINGGHSSTKVGSIEEYKTYHKAMYDGCNGVDSVWLQGNHDANYQGGDTFTLDEMYGYIGSNNKGNHNVEYGHENQLYGFIDYPTKRLRVIYLNSSDGWKTGVSDVQANWLSNTAFDFSDKSDKANWGIVIFIHIPVTFGDNAKILTAINNYSGEAKIIGIFHGHCHNFRTEKVTNKQIWQIGIPELCVGRNNEYAHSTDESYSSIFGEFDSEGNPVHYNKVSNTAQDTSFNIVTIDRTNKKIFCHNFGAGYDRVINYGEGTDVIVSYSVTNNLTNVSTNNTATTIQSGNAYTANLTAKDGYVLDTVTVTMGGVDITNTAYSNGMIIISKVTGNIVITATATSTSSGDETTYTNLFDPTADGFADLTRFSGSGETEGSCFLSNYISFAYGDVIRVRCPSGTYASGVGANQRVIRFYNSSKTLISDYYIGTTQDGCLVKDADGLGFTFTCNESKLTNGGYFRVCGNPNGKYSDFVITRNELINGSDEEETVVNYTITNNLTNVTSNNTVTTVQSGSNYIATLTANDGYNLKNVTITMGGIDITSTAYSNGVITISSITGNIVITATAVEIVAYTNLFSSTDPDFADAVRFNSSGGTTEGSGFVSGYIPVTTGDIIRVRCPGGNYSTDSVGHNIRNICTYNSSKKVISSLYPGDTTIDTDGVGFSYTITDSTIAFVRVCGHPNGNYANFVVTKNEIIE